MVNAISPEVVARQAIERAIVEMVIDDALGLGYTIQIQDMQIRSTDKAVLMSNIMAMDEDVLFFILPRTPEDDARDGFKGGFKRLGFAHFVYGNDGYDVLADHTESEAINAIIVRASNHAEALQYGG